MLVNYVEFTGPYMKNDDLFFITKGFDIYKVANGKDDTTIYYKKDLNCGVCTVIILNSKITKYVIVDILNLGYLLKHYNNVYEDDQYSKPYDLQSLNVLFKYTDFKINTAIIKINDSMFNNQHDVIKHIKKYWNSIGINTDMYSYCDRFVLKITSDAMSSLTISIQDMYPKQILGYNGTLEYFLGLNLTEQQLLGEE